MEEEPPRAASAIAAESVEVYEAEARKPLVKAHEKVMHLVLDEAVAKRRHQLHKEIRFDIVENVPSDVMKDHMMLKIDELDGLNE